MYHLFKSTRVYRGHPYCGPTSDYRVAEYKTLEEAKQAAYEFLAHNPVGWDIYDSETGKAIDSIIRLTRDD